MGVLPKLFKLWPWVDLDLFYATVKFGHIGLCMGKSENYLFFGTYCSFRSRSCLKHLAKWVYEVEWVSKVKVILWSWSKVTQISKLNVWFLACILRWAIQGLRALLFGNSCSLGSQICLKHLAKWVNEVEWVSKDKVILWPWSKVTQISKLKLVFLKNNWSIWNQSSYESLRENGHENLYKWVGSHDQYGHHAHLW